MALNKSPDEPFALVQPKAQPIRQERPAQPQTMAPGGGCNPAQLKWLTWLGSNTSETFLVNPLSYGTYAILRLSL